RRVTTIFVTKPRKPHRQPTPPGQAHAWRGKPCQGAAASTPRDKTDQTSSWSSKSPPRLELGTVASHSDTLHRVHPLQDVVPRAVLAVSRRAISTRWRCS